MSQGKSNNIQLSSQNVKRKASTVNTNVNTNNNISTVSETTQKTRQSTQNISTNPNTLNQGSKNIQNISSTPNSAPITPSVVEPESKTPGLTKIISRIIFLKMGQIDTRNERFDAEAYIECTWEDDEIFKYLSSPNLDKDGKNQNPTSQNQQNNNNPTSKNNQQNNNSNIIINPNATNIINVKNVINNINYLEYDPNLFWSPQLYIENAIGDLKEDIRHKLEIVEKEGSNLQKDTVNKLQNLANNLTVKVTEMRRVRGIFYERLELYDFPMDIQEISITLTSKRSVSEVEFVENPREASSINIEDFLDQQEWDLFDFVKTGDKIIEDPWRKYNRSAFLAKSYISRKPGYYLYNAYMLIFLITTLGFVPFAFDPNGPQFRCQVTGLLILTSVNFRWIVTQRLPSVPYLTSLDKYAIGSLFHLVLFCVWHSIIGSQAIASEPSNKKRFDIYFLYGSSTFFLFYNVSYACWFLKMSRSIQKFLDDGRSEFKKQAEERAIEFADPPSVGEEEESHTKQKPQPVKTNNYNDNKNSNVNNNTTKNNTIANSLSVPNTNVVSRGNNASNSQKSASINQTQQKNVAVNPQQKNMIVTVNPQQKNLATPQNSNPQTKLNNNISNNNLMVPNASPQQKLLNNKDNNINTPQPNKGPGSQQKMGNSLNNENEALLRVNSIGMNNMIKVNQKLNAV